MAFYTHNKLLKKKLKLQLFARFCVNEEVFGAAPTYLFVKFSRKYNNNKKSKWWNKKQIEKPFKEKQNFIIGEKRAKFVTMEG